jgi:hypothetical protein
MPGDSEGGSDEAIHWPLYPDLDCFAEPVIGARIRAARRLAMTLSETERPLTLLAGKQT